MRRQRRRAVIDVVIINWHCADEVSGALESLGDWRRHGTVWLVDNSADAEQAATLHTLAAEHGACRVLVPENNLGFGGGCNLAWAQSSSPYVLLLNPDARISAEGVLTLAAALETEPKLGAVSPRTWWDGNHGFLLPRPSTQGPWPALLPWRLALRPGRASRWATAQVLAERSAAAYAGVRRVDTLAGAVLLLRRAAVEAAGGLFDPRFFMFFEDTDLSLRLRRAGKGLALEQRAQAVHCWQAAPHKAPLMATSCQAYFEKHHRLFYRLSAGLRRLQPPPERVPEVAPEALPDRHQGLGPGCGPAVLAVSPSPLGWPAMFRPANAAPRPFDAAEWRLLAPGHYRALVVADDDTHQGVHWIRFHRAADEA